MGEDLHPAVAGVLRHFRYDHLPPRLQAISKPFASLAREVAGRTIADVASENEPADGPETTVALRKLLEAKDAAVRAALS